MSPDDGWPHPCTSTSPLNRQLPKTSRWAGPQTILWPVLQTEKSSLELRPGRGQMPQLPTLPFSIYPVHGRNLLRYAVLGPRAAFFAIDSTSQKVGYRPPLLEPIGVSLSQRSWPGMAKADLLYPTSHH